MSIDRVTHLLEQMHRSEDDAGDPIAADKVLVTDGARGFTWEDYGTGVSLSDDTPLVESGAGDAGVSSEASRSDHVHPEFGSGSSVPPPILLESGHAVPFTFDEILQESDGSDFLYASA